MRASLRAPAEHAVTEGEEPISGFERVRVGASPALVTDECGEQHEQRRTWLMKVGEQTVDRAKAMSRMDEKAGGTGSGAKRLGVARAALEHTDDGGPDRDHAPTAALRRLDRRRGAGRERVSLGMHWVVLDTVGADGSKRRQPDIEAKRGPADVRIAKPLDHRCGEVQPRGRCGSRVRGAGCVGGLIPLGVAQLAVNVWW